MRNLSVSRKKPPQDVFSQFVWEVNLGGYEWLEQDFPVVVQTAGGRKPRMSKVLYLVERIMETNAIRRYPVFRTETGLFLEFASTSPTMDGVREFASRYGRLGGGFGVPVGPEGSIGEPLMAWYNEIARLQELVELWRAARGIDSRIALDRVIRWRGNYAVAYVSPESSKKYGFRRSAVIASAEFQPEVLSSLKPGDCVRPAWLFLQESVNATLRDLNVCPKLLWNRSDRAGELGFYLSPSSLLGGMWLQFAYAIARDPKFGRCGQCRRWFEFTNGKRSDAKYCGDACRSRAYRESQHERNGVDQ